MFNFPPKQNPSRALRLKNSKKGIEKMKVYGKEGIQGIYTHLR